MFRKTRMRSKRRVSRKTGGKRLSRKSRSKRSKRKKSKTKRKKSTKIRKQKYTGGASDDITFNKYAMIYNNEYCAKEGKDNRPECEKYVNACEWKDNKFNIFKKGECVMKKKVNRDVSVNDLYEHQQRRG